MGNVSTAALRSRSGPIADAAFVISSNAVVDIVADSVVVIVSDTTTATHTQSVFNVAIAITFSFRDVGTTTVVNGAGAVALTAHIEGSNTGVHVVTDAVVVRICSTGTTTDVQGVELVAVAIAIAGGNVGASAGIGGTGAVADTTGVHRTHTGVDIVAHAVHVGIGGAGSAAHAKSVVGVACAITIARRDAASTAHAALVHCGTRAIGRVVVVAGHRVRAVVTVVAEAVTICISRAGAAAHPERVRRVAIAIAVARGDRGTTTVINLAGAVALATGIEGAHARVDIVANAVHVSIGCAAPTAVSQSVELVAVAVAISSGNAGAATNAAHVRVQTVCIASIGIVAGHLVGTVVPVVADAVTVAVRARDRHVERGGGGVAVNVDGRVGHRRGAFLEGGTGIDVGAEGLQGAVVCGARCIPGDHCRAGTGIRALGNVRRHVRDDRKLSVCDSDIKGHRGLVAVDVGGRVGHLSHAHIKAAT